MSNREKKVQEIFNHAEKIGYDKASLSFTVAIQCDKSLTKFHKDFLEKKSK